MRHPLVLLPVLLATLVGAPPALAWTWPTDGPVLQPFVLGDDPYAAGQHRGIDVAGVAGTPVRAPADGYVSFAGTVPGGGRTVTIQTADGYAVTLLHLGALGVTRGVDVEEGAAVGSLGASGDLEHPVPYVHVGVRVAADPQGYLDPLLFLPPRAPAAGGEVVAPEAEVEPVPEAEPVPPQGAETGGPDIDAGSGPGDADGSTPATPASPAVVEVPALPAVPVETPAPAVVEVPAQVADSGRTGTAGDAGSAVDVTTAVAAVDGARSTVAAAGEKSSEAPAQASSMLIAEPDAPTRGARPEPAEAETAGGALAAGRPRIPIGLAVAAALGLAAGALGLLLRRRVPALPLPALDDRQAESTPVAADAEAHVRLELDALEPHILPGARRRARPPGGPDRRLERLGPHGDRPATVPSAGRGRTRTEPVDAWR